MQNTIQLFENKQIRSIWDSEQEKWYFAIVDIIAALTESLDAPAYWRKLKQRLKAEGNESVTNCHALKPIKQKKIIFNLSGSLNTKKAVHLHRLFFQQPKYII